MCVTTISKPHVQEAPLATAVNETAIYRKYVCLCAHSKDRIMNSSGLFEVHTKIKVLTQLHLDFFPTIWQPGVILDSKTVCLV